MVDSKNDTIRVVDFGLAKIVPNDQRTATICGTVQYMGLSVE